MKKRYVLAGASGRAFSMFAKPITEKFNDVAELTGIFVINMTRAEYFRKNAAPQARLYRDFDEMMNTEKPDVLIVATIDRYHHEYIIRGLEWGCDVITEKPMTIDADRCNQILEAEKRTGRKVNVTFNCRFMPYVRRIKELLNEGIIGDILNVDYEYLLDRHHGADYFRRWHSRKENSGGLLVHKATHHFDMVNWWIDQTPDVIYANGDRRFYGPTRKETGERCLTCPYKNTCEFAFAETNDPHVQGMYFIPEKEDGYMRDRCIFSDQINIEDTMSVAVRYKEGALLTYSLVTYSPYEGWKIAFTGTKGRLEAASYHTGDRASEDSDYVKFFNDRGEVITYKMPKAGGTHAGGDVRLLEMLIRGNMPDPLGQIADVRAGINSVMIGACANMSIADGKPHRIDDYIHWT